MWRQGAGTNEVHGAIDSPQRRTHACMSTIELTMSVLPSSSRKSVGSDGRVLDGYVAASTGSLPAEAQSDDRSMQDQVEVVLIGAAEGLVEVNGQIEGDLHCTRNRL